MSGTRIGALKAVKTTKKLHGKDFFEKAGQVGGRTSVGGGFAWMSKNNPERLREIGSKGGKKSKRHAKDNQ